MRTKAKDDQVTSDKHLGRGFLILAALEICAGMNCILPRPASRCEKGIEPVGVRSLVSVRNDLAARTAVPLGCVCNSPFNHGRIERHFQLRYQSVDLFAGE